MPIDVMAIIGESHTHKTSAMRALTGAGRNQPSWTVSYIGINLSTYVQLSALQEAAITAQQFINDVNVAGVTRVLVALRTRSRQSQGVNYPDAASYLSNFQLAGWNILPHVELVAGTRATLSLVNLNPGLLIASASNIPANQIASRLRALWKVM